MRFYVFFLIVALFIKSNSIFITGDIPNEIFEADKYDVILSDIKTEVLEGIAKLMNFEYNNATTNDMIFPLTGIMYGLYERIVFPIIVESKYNKVQSLFIYDSTCPYIYISESTRIALGMNDLLLSNENIRINGRRMFVSQSINQFKNINIFGNKILRLLDLDLIVNSYNLKAYLQKSNEIEIETENNEL